MPVGVVRPDRDERHPRAAGSEERRIGVPAAVVRNLQHIRAQVGSGGEDPRLGLGAQVAGEEDPHTALHDPDDHRQVVRLRGRGGPLRRRGQHLDRRLPDRPPVAGHEDRALPAAATDQAVERALPLVVGSQRAGGHDPHRPTGERAGQTGRVVGVQVRHEDQRERVDPEPVQAPIDRADVRPGVDEDAGPGSGRHDEGIPLPDVAGDHEGVRRWPAPDHLPQRPTHRDQAHQRGQRERPDPWEPPQRPGPREEQQREQGGAARPGRPARRRVRQRCRALGDQDEPTRRPAGATDEKVRGGGQQWTEDRRRQSEHRGRCDRGGGQQVGRQRDQADRSGEARDEGRRGQAGGGADGEGIGQDGPASAGPQPPRPGGRHQHDRRRRRHRQGEPGVACQARVEEQQHADGRSQGRQRGPWSPRRQRQQRDRTHGGGPHDARARPRQHDEPAQQEPRDGRPHTAVHHPAPQGPEHRREDDRHVRPGHRGEVGEPGAPEVLVEHRVHGPRVADDQSGQQSGRPLVQDPGRGRRQTLAERTRGPEQQARSAQWSRGTSGRDHGGHVVPRPRCGETRTDAHRLSGHQVAPALGGCEEQDVRVQPVHCGPVRDDGNRRVRDHPRAAGRRQHVGRVAQFEDELRRASHLRQGAERGRLPRSPPDGGGRRGDGQSGEHRQGDGRRPPVPSTGHGRGATGRADRAQRQLRRGEQRRDGADRPDRGGDGRKPEIHPDPAPGRLVVGPWAPSAGHTPTSSASSAAIAGPMPGTSSS